MRFSRFAAPVLAFLCATIVIAFVNSTRLAHVNAVTAAGDQVARFDPRSSTGYAGEVRSLILPNHDAAGYQWIVQAQQATARDTWRVRHVDYDNAPFGRTVLTPSPYRWWLAFVGQCRHLYSNGPLAANVERGSLVADPAIEIGGLLLIGLFVTIGFGGAAAAAAIVAAGFLFPFAATFLAAELNDSGAAMLAAVLAMAAVLAGIRRSEMAAEAGSAPSRWFVLGGVFAGFTMWLNAPLGAATGISLAIASFVAEILSPRDPGGTARRAPLWMAWAGSAAAVTLVASLIEYFPSDLEGAHLEYIHPLYGLGWVGLGGLLSWSHRVLANRTGMLRWRSLGRVSLAAGLVALPIVVGWRNGSFSAAAAARALSPTHLDRATGSDSAWQWFRTAGISWELVGMLVPLAAIVAAGIFVWRRRRASAVRPLMIALLVATLLLVAAIVRLSWTGLAEAATIALLAALAESTMTRRFAAWLWCAVAVTIGGLGTVLLRAEVGSARNSTALTEADIVALVERDLSIWLAGRAGPGGAVVLAPPSLSTSLFYYGNLRVLGTPYWENKDGMQAAVRLSAASSPDEGLALAGKREVRFIVLPSWDDSLDRLVRLASNSPDKSLLGLLHQWLAPRWLRPVPYPLPAIPGFEGRSVAVFEVVDVQDPAVALSRLAECFVEMGRLDDAGKVATAIGHNFPADLGVHVARANVAAAFGDTDRLAEDMKVLTSEESLANASALPWDRQVSYAIALAQGQRMDLARKVLEHALGEIDEAKVRFLTPQSLYRLQLLCKVSGLEIADPKLRSLAHELLPPEIRDKV